MSVVGVSVVAESVARVGLLLSESLSLSLSLVPALFSGKKITFEGSSAVAEDVQNNFVPPFLSLFFVSPLVGSGVFVVDFGGVKRCEQLNVELDVVLEPSLCHSNWLSAVVCSQIIW